jgi:hypothetical protein
MRERQLIIRLRYLWRTYRKLKPKDAHKREESVRQLRETVRVLRDLRVNSEILL